MKFPSAIAVMVLGLTAQIFEPAAAAQAAAGAIAEDFEKK